MNKYRVLVKNLGYSFIVGFLPNAMGFLLIPLYTAFLTTKDYGVAELIMNTVQLVLPLLTLQIHDAVLRFTLDKKWEKREVFSIGAATYILGAMIVTVLCIVLIQLPICRKYRGYLLFFLACYIATALYRFLANFCRGIDQMKILTESNICGIISSLVCYIVFLTAFRWGLFGYMAAYTIGLLFNLGYIWWKIKPHQYLCGRLNKRLAQEMLTFSLPLVSSAIFWWVNSASDRYILRMFTDVTVVGIYSLAYKIPTILKVVGDIVSMAFSISAIKEFDPEDSDGFIGKSYSVISLSLTLACSILIFGNVFLAKLLYAGDFYEAWKYVPLLLFSVTMSQMAVTCENIFVAAKQTKIISKTAVVGAAVNTILNVFLIPVLGAMGAAIATAIGFFCFWVFRYLKLRKVVRIKDNPAKELISYGLVLTQCIIACGGNQLWYLQSIIILAIVLIFRTEIAEAIAIFYRVINRRNHGNNQNFN